MRCVGSRCIEKPNRSVAWVLGRGSTGMGGDKWRSGPKPLPGEGGRRLSGMALRKPTRAQMRRRAVPPNRAHDREGADGQRAARMPIRRRPVKTGQPPPEGSSSY